MTVDDRQTSPGGETVGAGGLLTLAVTSSTGVMSLAIGRVSPSASGATMAAVRPSGVEATDLPTERRHAEELVPRLVELLARGGYRPADLALLAVDIGPGRFTGLRVGLATVRGLAFALGVPVVAATSLEILAAGAGAGAGAGAEAGMEGTAVTAVVDARRQEVFQQVVVDGRAGPARVGRPEDLAPEARGLILGDGFDRYRDVYLGSRPETETGAEANGSSGLVPLAGRHPRAVDLLGLAATRPAVPGAEIRPLYLREPDATANIRTRSEVVSS